MFRRYKFLTGLLGGGAFILVLLIVIGNVAVAHTNPPVTYTVKWDSPRTEELARRACFDCHSNETKYPWYSYVAPVSFLVMKDVNEGREEMNFSTGRGELEGGEMVEALEEGEMPLPIYLVLHPEAALTEAEKTELAQGLRLTFG